MFILMRNKPLRQIMGVLETLNLLCVRLLLRRPEALRLYPGIVFRNYMSLVGHDKWDCMDISKVVSIPTGTRITLEHLPGEGILTPIDELAYLALITKALHPSSIFEIGTFRGRTALNFALNSPPHCVVYTLDLPSDRNDNLLTETNRADTKIVRASFTGVDYVGKDAAHKIRQLYGNSIEFDFSSYYRKMDMVFVDGAHHYKAVRSDTDNALRMVAPGGVIIWHDFANYGDYNDVTRAVIDAVSGGRVVQIASTQLAVYKHPGED